MSTSRHRPRSPSRSRSPSPFRLPHHAKPISESDFFLKSDEFRVWLKDSKGKFFNDLSGDKARSYFRKFVKVWNRGKLDGDFYKGIDSVAPHSNTAYKWSFASGKSKLSDSSARESSDRGRVLGPTMPTRDDLAMAREVEEEARVAERTASHKREREEVRDRVEDAVGPREVGREGMLEKKRMRRENDRTLRDAKEDGGDIDVDTLMGGDSFQQRIAQRDAARKRFQEKKQAERDGFTMEKQERVATMREKDKTTMDMFKELAKQRFG